MDVPTNYKRPTDFIEIPIQGMNGTEYALINITTIASVETSITGTQVVLTAPGRGGNAYTLTTALSYKQVLDLIVEAQEKHTP